jgi:thioester reductase-like protein
MTAASSTQRQEILRRALFELKEARGRVAALEGERAEPIAIVGMGCRFPGGADGPAELWDLLRSGRDAISEVPPERWDLATWYDADPDAPGKTYARHGGFIDGIDQFDAALFGIPPREAVALDPQHRLVLEVAWAALEDAVLAPDSLRDSRTGVFMGMTTGEYAHLAAKTGDPRAIDAYLSTGNAPNFASGRLSFVLGLRGPSLVVDTACSSSLVTVHLACQSLRAGECDLALAGGVNALLLPETTVALSKARMLSPDGRCKTFDTAADGYVRGEGCGVVVLRRLSDALAAGQQPWAVIRGSAVNQDGHSSGVTVPFAGAQEEVVRSALAAGGVDPLDVAYVEAHGTGTPLGDPIELRALARVLGAGRARERSLLVGSLKTNLGHLEAAAGVAGLMKTALALAHGEVPPHLHLREPTPHVEWDRLPLRVASEAAPLDGDAPIAGVSAFGISGTNAHVVLQAAPAGAAVRSQTPAPAVVVKVAARGPDALARASARLADFVETAPEVSPADVAHVAGAGRADLPDRVAVVATSRVELLDGLRAAAGGRPAIAGRAPAARPRVAFLVPGQGSRLAGAARELYAGEPAAARTLDELAEAVGPVTELPLAALLEPGADAEQALVATDVAQPALYALALALAAWWRHAGVAPDVLLGHSAGAYAAAALAGVIAPADGARLVAQRGRLMATLAPGGAMAAVRVAPDGLADSLSRHPRVAMAAHNAPDETVLSGPADALAGLLGELGATPVQPLAVDTAFHSSLIEPMLDELDAALAATALSPARTTLISDTTGRPAGPEVATAAYWVEHARRPVRFADAVRALDVEVLVELGPASTLLGLARRTLAGAGPERAYLPSLRPGRPASHQLRCALGAAWTRGVPVTWRSLAPPPAQRLSLPTYPFERRRHWLRTPARADLSVARTPLLAEHAVHGLPVVPGVVYLDLILSAAERAGMREPVITELTLHAPLVVGPEETAQVDVRVDGAVARLASGDGTLHATAAVSPSNPRVVLAPVALDAIRRRCPRELTGEEFYTEVWHPEFALGPRFRLLDEIHAGDGEALARVRVPPREAAGVRPELLALDAAVQALMAAAPPAAPDGPVALGSGYEAFTTHATAFTGGVWAWAILRDEGRSELRGDVYVLDDDGVPLAEIHGVRFRRVGKETLRRLAASAGVAAPARRPGTLTAARLAQTAPDDRISVLEGYLGGEVAAVLGLTPTELDLDQPLVSQADSLMLAELKVRVETDLEIELPLEALFDEPTVRALARRLASARDAAGPRVMSTAELAAEAALDPAIAPAAARRPVHPDALLLTGATGFVGAFLLDQLLAGTGADVHCLVRAESQAAARARVDDNLRAYGLDAERAAGRVVPVLGDLEQPRLGLEPDAFDALAATVDGIVHCGAAVNWTYPYGALKAANVLGTQEVLRLACARAALPVHHISTVGVFSSLEYEQDVVDERVPLERSGALAVGYAQSKWVAEAMVRTAAERGLPVTIHRLSTGGHSATGAFNPRDHVCLALKACVELGHAPDSTLPVQIAPVDFVARAVVEAVLRPELAGRTFHLVNPRPITWTELFDVVETLGYPLRRSSLPDWQAALATRARSGGETALAGLLPFISDTLAAARLPVFDCARSLADLRSAAIDCPPIDAALLRTYFTRFSSSSFLRRPPPRTPEASRDSTGGEQRGEAACL